ncbi:NAD(P)/FAD-dependent oxidoreductase [archaeon]|nr:NAD(P)/FAD-dependent oxidoreductase [archaeon]
MYDLVIVGAGPAGLSTAMSAEELNLHYLVLDKIRVLNTLYKYTMDKEIMDYPKDVPVVGPPAFHQEKAIEILKEWSKKARECEIVIEEVINIKQENGHYVVKTHVGQHKTANVAVAIGLQGNARCIGIPGEHQENVFHNKLPKIDFKGKNVIVVGGGDSALEASMIAKKGNADVLLSYRKPEFTRPKKENVERINASGIRIELDSKITSIEHCRAILQKGDKEEELPCDYLLICAGTESSAAFLEKNGIKIARVNDFTQEPIESKQGLFVIGDLIGRPSIKMAVNQGSKVAEIVAKRKKEGD